MCTGVGTGVSCIALPQVQRTNRLSERITLVVIEFFQTCASELYTFTCYIAEIIWNNETTQLFWTTIKGYGESVAPYAKSFFTSIYKYIPIKWTWNTILSPIGRTVDHIFFTYIWDPIVRPLAKRIWAVHPPAAARQRVTSLCSRFFSPIWNRIVWPIGNWTVVPIAKQVGGVVNGVQIALFGAEPTYFPHRAIGDEDNPQSFVAIQEQLRAIDPERERIGELHIYHETFQPGEEAILRAEAVRFAPENLAFHFAAKIFPS